MKANNLTISVPAPCNLNCPYCISKMTFSPEVNMELFSRNLHKAKELASLAQVSSVLVTSKGEPLLTRLPLLLKIGKVFQNFPLEMQTNGTLLNESIIEQLYKYGFNIIAISINKPIDFYSSLFELINKYNMISRITIVLAKERIDSERELYSGKIFDIEEILNQCKTFGIRQLTLRRATVPENRIVTTQSNTIANWITNHRSNFNSIPQHEEIRSLPWGMKTMDLDKISVSIIDYCIQENHNEDDIRSLIYHQDGHMYTIWNKPSSILF